MPTITCPTCNRYVQVPNVNGTQSFNCPSCLPGTNPKVLYKCNSCMKVTILTARAKVCSQCKTMLRPDGRGGLQPQLAPLALPSVATDWTYHTTSIGIASSIKRAGLIPSFIRTGLDTAHPQGAFARNRDMRLSLPVNNAANPILQKIKVGVALLLYLGLSENQISALSIVPPAIDFIPTGQDTDAENLTTQTDDALVRLAGLAGKANATVGMLKLSPFIKVWRESRVTTLACQIIVTPAHCLTLWATQYVTLYYRVEEVKTVHSVYFLKNAYASEGYDKYTKGQSKAVIAILRVRRAQIVELVDDLSEEMAERTLNVVKPEIIEIFTQLNPDFFSTSAHRDNDANWVNIKSWGV